MPPFQYTGSVNPYVGSISELLLRPGDIEAQRAERVAALQAHAAEVRGQARAGAVQAIGQQAAGAVQSAIEERKNAPIRALQTQALQQSVTEGGQRIESNQMTLQTAKRGVMGQTVLAEGIKQFGDDFQKVAQFVAKNGFPDVAAAYTESSAKGANALRDFKNGQVADADTAQAFEADQLQRILGLNDPAAQQAAWTASLGLMKAHGVDTSTLAPTWDPAAAQSQLTLSAPKPKPLVVGADSSVIDANNPSGPALFTGTPKIKPGTPEAFLETYAKEKFGIPAASMTVAQQSQALGAFKEANADQDLRNAALAQRNLAAAMAQMQISLMPTKEQAASVAEDMVNHRIAPEQLASLFSTRGKEGLAFKLAVSSEAKKLDPTFNFEEASATYQLAKSAGFQNTVRYMDAALESMPRLLKTATALGNGQFRTLNQIANAAKNQFNDTDLKRFKTDALLVGDEVAKILSGGGTGSATSDAKLKQGVDLIGQTDSVPAIAAAMDEINFLIGNRRRALTRGTYMEGTSAVKPSATSGPTDGQAGSVNGTPAVWKSNGPQGPGWYAK